MIVEEIYRELEKKKRLSYKPSGNYASQVGHPCERHLVYQRLDYDKKPLPNINKILLFREGNAHEADVIKLLLDSGVKVSQTQRPFEWKELELSGRIDGIVTIEGKDIPIEIKSVNAYDFEKLNRVEDFFKSKRPWVRGWIAQLTLYVLMSNKELGLMILKNKQTGGIKEIEVPLDYQFGEQLAKKLERINAHVKANTYPERIEDRSVCQYCDFKAICLPDEHYDEVKIDNNDELTELLEKRDALKYQAKQYEEINDQLQRVWKRCQEGTYLVGGKFQVKITNYERDYFNVPDEVKNQYKETTTISRTVITNIHDNNAQ